MSDTRQLEIEFLESARNCGASLQKSLAASGLVRLCRDLAGRVMAGAWRPARHVRFAVEEPKLREIFAPCFADRIVEAWLIGHLEPVLERLYIDDSYANRKGKGPLAAVIKAQKLMRRPGHEWCLQMDVQGFFCSIHRPTLAALWAAGPLNKAPTPWRPHLEYVSRTLMSADATADYVTARSSRPLLDRLPAHKSLLGSPPETGLPIGSVASQHFANFYLSGLDHFIKHELRVKGYLRYMDDLLLLGPSPEVLTNWRGRAAEYLRALRLEFHPGKEKLQRADKGFEYLGFRVYPHHSHLCSRTVGALKARLDFFKHLLRPDEYPKYQAPARGFWHDFAKAGFQAPVEPDYHLLKSMEATVNSYFGLMGQADNFRLRRDIFHRHFGPLKKFFAPGGPDYLTARVKKRFL